MKEENVGFYSCIALNELGKDSAKVFVNLCSPETDPECKSFAVMGSKINKVLLISTFVTSLFVVFMNV
jgi:hypothetical protein